MLKPFRPRATVALRTLAAGPLLALALTACGGSDASDADGASGQDAPSVNAAPVDPTDWYVKYASCMRGRGVDIPDPSADGQVTTSRDLATEAGQAADAACREELGPPPATQDDAPGGSQAEQDDSILELTQCLRDKGYDVEDPEEGQALGIDAPPDVLKDCGFELGSPAQ